MKWHIPVRVATLLFALGGAVTPACATTPTIHKTEASSVFRSMAPGTIPPMKPDQVNTEGWNQAWTNLVNDAAQTFTPSLPKLLGVEVKLVVGNAGEKEDELTLSVLDPNGEEVVSVTQSVSVSECDQALFVIPNGGIDVTPGNSYRIRLTGGITFGWKYVVGGYPKGAATFNGKPLLRKARSTFLFRTFGAS